MKPQAKKIQKTSKSDQILRKYGRLANSHASDVKLTHSIRATENHAQS